MMRHSNPAAFAAVMLAVVSCTKTPCLEEHPFNLEVVAFEDVTKSNYLTEQSEERRINALCYLVVNSDGCVVAKEESSLGGASGCSIPLRLAPGTYDYVVVANGPDISECSDLSAALSMPVPFDAYNNLSNGYCMVDIGNFNVDRRVKRISCVLSRISSRVCLRSVTNELPSDFGVFVPESSALENALVGPISVGGLLSGTPERARNSAHELSGIEIKTGESFGWTQPLCHYAYPDNALEPTVLTLAGRIGGILYYYPVRLPHALESNTTVALDLTIRNLGSADPLVPAEEGAIEAAVTLERWKEGNTHSNEI